MATTKSIAAALKLVDGKKENLRKAFEDLQSHSSSLPSSFTFTWSDLDSYFTSLQSSLERKFKLLQSLESQPDPRLSKSSPKKLQPSIPARPKLIEFCEKMDGMGLRRYMVLRLKELTAIRDELNHALMCAPDAAALVLDAIHGFFPPNRDFEMGAIRSCCLALLEQFVELKPVIGAEVKEKAKKMAMEWRKSLSLDGENPTEELGFLELVAGYGLKDCFNMDDLINCLVIVSRRRQALNLCKILNIPLPELIQRLISKGNQVLALKFIFEFAMADKFPPVPLLKEYLKGISHVVEEIRNNGKLNDAIMKEKSALKSVIKCIEDYKLDSEYPKDTLIQRIENLDKEKDEKKRSAAASPATKPQQQNTGKRARTNKQAGPGPRTATTIIAASSEVAPPQPQVFLQHHPAPTQQPQMLLPHHHDPAQQPQGVMPHHPAIPQQQQVLLPHHHDLTQQPQGVMPHHPAPPQQPQVLLPHHHDPTQQPQGLMPHHPAPPQQQPHGLVPHYPAQSAQPYRLPDTNPAGVTVNGHYGWQGGPPVGYSGNPTPNGYPTEPQMPGGYFGAPTSNGHPTEPQMPAGCYGGPPTYGGYALPPQYHPSYYPQ